MGLQFLWRWYFRIPIFLRLLITVFFFMTLFGITIHYVEPNNFKSILDGIWWAFVTGSTVGYGDFVPLTVLGKLIAICMILAGGGIVTYYMVTVSSEVVKKEYEIEHGEVKYRGNNHVIIVGWNERTRKLIEMINDHHHENIVLIDETLEEVPRKFPAFFVKGNPSTDKTLNKANISAASKVVITSDQSKEEGQADQQSILITVAVKGMNEKVPIITEILTKEQVENAKRAGAHSVIRSNDFMSTLFFHELYREKPLQPFNLILKQLSNQQYLMYDLPDHLDGKTFLQCSDHLVQKDELLIGVLKNGELQINPPFQQKVHKGDQLLVLSSL
ncbi:potassium channel family protein [Salirhabdus salicampi]|uniref:potassium channel family protein n=1 Tax=Salirhabdus salicampi TaxID=476102 RepID=UPI0020C47F21|nr:potassium channel family protein [Salirhabdus salicampi]MCP8617782.1 potassium channel family protein [Salirhabdus salicampi]